jgi:hypothetical protein
MALGALIGGLLLAGTEYRRQVEVTTHSWSGRRRVPDLRRHEPDIRIVVPTRCGVFGATVGSCC